MTPISRIQAALGRDCELPSSPLSSGLQDAPMFEPLFFRDEQLFGCYHPAAGIDSQRLLVICPPLFDDYRRSYKAMGDLARACAGKGVHVLRFDYFGTGESKGLLEEASIEIWQKDIEAAVDEGMALSGAGEVMLFGIRFGALLASRIRHARIRRYIFWDPVESGAAYLEWLDEVNQLLRKEHRRSARNYGVRFDHVDYENFRLPPALKSGIEAITFDRQPLPGPAGTLIIATDPALYASQKYPGADYPGLNYSWPAYHEGIIVQKPVLKAVARRVLMP